MHRDRIAPFIFLLSQHIENLVDISRERAKHVDIDHAALDISGHALKAAEDRLETMKREGQTVCSLEAEVEINAYIKIADEMNQRITDARAKVASLLFPEINNYLFRSRHFRNFEIDL